MTSPIPPQLPVAPDRPALPPPMFAALRIASTGLSAQSFRMEVVAMNLANAETTRTPEGGPYQRRTVTLEAEPPAPASVSDATVGGEESIEAGDLTGGVRIAGVGVDATPGLSVYDPGHPDADASGYVQLPNVDMTQELVDLTSARRLYQANATVFEVGKAMLNEATQI